MFVYKIKINGRKAVLLSADNPTSGSTNVDTVEFEFSPEWENLNKKAVFFTDDNSENPNGIFEVGVENNKAEVPPEVLEEFTTLNIGCYGVSEKKEVISSSFVGIEIKDGAPVAGTVGSDYKNVYVQLLAQYQKAENKLNQIKEDAESGKFNGKSAYEIAVYYGYQGTEEEWLEDINGKDGYTPVKGEDYFTNDEKEEIITEAAGRGNVDGYFIKKINYAVRTDFVNDGYYSLGTVTDGTKVLNENTTNTSFLKASKITLPAGTYSIGPVRGIFSVIENLKTQELSRLADTDAVFKGQITLTDTSNIYLTIGKNELYDNVMLVNEENFPEEIPQKGIFAFDTIQELDSVIKTKELIRSAVHIKYEIHVKSDGTGDFTSLVEAVNSIHDSSADKEYDIYIYDDHDIIAEMGGDTYLASINKSTSARTGLHLPDYVNLLGVRKGIKLTGIIDDNSQYATQYVSQSFSPLELYQNNRLENLTIIGRNVRYAVHDESAKMYDHYHRIMRNVHCIHQGNIDGIWSATRAVACGTSSGCVMEYYDCIFESAKGAAYTIHDNNAISESIDIRFENCIFDSEGKITTAAVGFSTVSDSSVLHKVTMNSCQIHGMIFQYNEAAGEGNAFDISGSGNSLCCHVTNSYSIRQGVRFTDEVSQLRNDTNETITKGSCVKLTANGCQLAVTTKAFYGIALEDIESEQIGAVKHKGFICNADTNMSYSENSRYGISEISKLKTDNMDYVVVGINYLCAQLKKGQSYIAAEGVAF